MTLYDILMVSGAVVLAGIVVKAFWSSTSVKPKEQPDNWQGYPPHGEGQ